jgi:hypothetical protein
VQQCFPASYYLLAVNKFDEQKFVSAKLPRTTPDGFDLDRNRASIDVGCQKIVGRDVSREWRGDVAPPPQLGGYEVLSDLPCKLIAVTSGR